MGLRLVALPYGKHSYSPVSPMVMQATAGQTSKLLGMHPTRRITSSGGTVRMSVRMAVTALVRGY